MDTEGPISVLDRRTRSSSSSRDKVIADRITRQRSPGPAFRGQRGRRVPSRDSIVGEEDEAQEVIYRISQPYRTSFSAKHSVTWGKVDRSRSLSPTSSLRSDSSRASAPPIFYTGGDKKRPRGRSKSPKRVTYNSKVTVRHSDTEDSMFTELSSHELEEVDLTPQRPGISPFSRALISPRYNEFSQLSPIPPGCLKTAPQPARPKVMDVTNMARGGPQVDGRAGDVSHDSGLDYSTELKDLSDQITRMQWSPRQNRVILGKPPPGLGPGSRHSPRPVPTSTPSPHGILKDSQNSRLSYRESPVPTTLGVSNVVPNGSATNGGSGHPSGQANGVSPGWSANNNGSARNNKGKENDPRSSPQKSGTDSSVKFIDTTEYIARDYEHNRMFSYTDALKGQYGEDISRLAKVGLMEAESTVQQQSPSVDKVNGGLHISSQLDQPLVINTNQHGGYPASSSPADTSQGESSPDRGSPTEPGRLTPSKRSVSLSISNFLKRVSPHFRRKKSKDRPGQSRSAEGSAQSLANTTSDPDTDRESPTNDLTEKPKRPSKFSRSQVRQSFMKLVGRSSSKSKKKNKNQPGDIIPTPSHYTIELQDPEKNTSSDEVDEITNGFMLNSSESLGKAGFDPSTHRMMKSIEQNTRSEQDIYRRFKDRQSSREAGDAALSDSESKTTPTGLAKPEPIRPTALERPTLDQSASEFLDEPMDFFTESDITAILRPDLNRSHLKAAYFETPVKTAEEESPSRAEPPRTLDVLPVRTKRLMQTSVMSSISGDESIGECSLDANMTASEPSLLSGISQSAASKQIVVPSSLVTSAEGQLTCETSSVKLRRPRDGQSNKENNVPLNSSNSSSGPPSPVDPNHKPSYLKLSCAVSGYGKYSRYSTYKDVNKRSPYSSQSSLRSDASSSDPSMPAEQRSGDESTPEHKRQGLSGWSTAPTSLAVNGHVLTKHPVGDPLKDGEYFLQIVKFEEERLRELSLRADAHLRSHDLPEEACGRIRSATGKANLLISQKFIQFKDLCQNHMKPDPEERETKWEDLEGFWDMVKIQVDNVDDLFAEIELMKDNGWQEIPKLTSRRSSASSSPKSGSLSQASTPSATPAHTPGSRRKNLKVNGSRDTPDSSPDRAQKTRQAAKARDEARKKMLAERRAAMKQATATPAGNGEDAEVEIYLAEPVKK